MPFFHGTTVIAEAIRFFILDEQGRQIIKEIEGEDDVKEFVIVKGEDSERDLKLSSISIYQLESYVIP
ncbi:hypothetical protein FOVG_18570 [Fusarium oxysporum f. sp. pisi HDV247]|uniref:Uncharacterized protein n=1 Tax=Fusarium oxysporum f. sp. pisi HDV247 TaxID=1080344 RepID=W9NB54_FUSOX|nr:hypothetical protein FOVG_18570 [Fusarium oxysporum f. sp. pisi HDV247]